MAWRRTPTGHHYAYVILSRDSGDCSFLSLDHAFPVGHVSFMWFFFQWTAMAGFLLILSYIFPRGPYYPFPLSPTHHVAMIDLASQAWQQLPPSSLLPPRPITSLLRTRIKVRRSESLSPPRRKGHFKERLFENVTWPWLGSEGACWEEHSAARGVRARNVKADLYEKKIWLDEKREFGCDYLYIKFLITCILCFL